MSARRFLVGGACTGAALGFLFALAVVSFADCAGPHCTRERVVGVLGHAAGGALLGAVLAGVGVALARLFGRGGR